MSRPVLLTAFALSVVGSLIFLYKAVVLEMPIEPDHSARVWRVELSVLLRGHDESSGKVSLLIPQSDSEQVILDEQTDDDGLALDVTQSDEFRLANWRGPVGEFRRVSFTFRVHLPRPVERMNGTLRLQQDSSGTIENRDSIAVPEPIRDVLQKLRIEEADEPASVVATIFGFVTAQIERAPGGSEDALLTLMSREGSDVGRSRLMVAMLRAAGLDARLATGLRLSAPRESRWAHFAEADVDGHWLGLFPNEETPGRRPANFLVVARGDRPVVASSNLVASDPAVRVLRESLQPAELAAFMAPAGAFWRALSLYRLPLGTQDALRVLLVIPAAALVAAVYRNLIGIRTFGTFMPILIALSLRRTDIFTGAALVSSVILAGVLGRLLLDRLRLLFVPRICLLLCIVVLNLTGIALIGDGIGGHDLVMTGLLFPIVILAMLIERISVTTLEEGYASAVKLLAGSLLLSLLAYPVFRSEWVAHLFFGFPELVFPVMATLVLIGGYNGYRISEFWRFRSLVVRDAEAGS